MEISISFRKKKKKSLTFAEYDKLVDAKVGAMRSFFLTSINVRDDSEKFDDKVEQVFGRYLKYIYAEAMTMKEVKNDVELPNMVEIWKKNHRKEKKEKFIRKITYVFRLLAFKVMLLYHKLGLMYEIRKVRKLFPDRKLSSEMTLSLLRAVEVNKRVMQITDKKNDCTNTCRKAD